MQCVLGEDQRHVRSPVEAVYCSLEAAKAGLQRADFVFWDTRSNDEYTGNEAGFRSPPRPGHIPGAAHLEWTELFDPESRTFKPAAELRQLLEARGITPDKHVASYCNGGARGAHGGFVLRVLGYDRGQAYAGSFANGRASRTRWWSASLTTPFARSRAAGQLLAAERRPGYRLANLANARPSRKTG